jgi:uncharacterized membrane protein required for colicin V production
MTALDWLILAATALFAVSGYLRGFIVAALSLVGFTLGAIAGTRIAQLLLPAGDASPYAPLFGLVAAVLVGALLASGFEGFGQRLRRALPRRSLGVLDGLGGALLSAAIALGIAWVVGVILIALPNSGSLRATIESSLILRRLDELLPPSGDLLLDGERRTGERGDRAWRRGARRPAQCCADPRLGVRARDRGVRLGDRAG